MSGFANPWAIEWRGTRFRYPGSAADSLSGVELGIREGEFALIAGPTGCGKTTLLKTANGWIPRESAGGLEGSITLFGRGIDSIPSSELRSLVGLLFQNPNDQLLCRTAEEEVAFAPENLGLPPGEIGSRVREALACAAAAPKRFARCDELSGGEKQRVALASLLSLRPQVLLLDEPTSQLDGRGAREILDALSRLRAERGLTLIVAEHRIERLLPLADRLIVMEEGRVAGDYPKDAFLESLPLLRRLGLDVPPWMEIAERVGIEDAEGEEAVCAHLIAAGSRTRLSEGSPRTGNGRPLLRVRHLGHRYGSGFSLQEISFDLLPGEVLALMGPNGAGKTTLLNLLVGFFPIRTGAVEWFGEARTLRGPYALAGRTGYLFQNSDLMLSAETVFEEVSLGPDHLAFGPERRRKAVEESLGSLRLSHVRGKNPFSLSQGERLKVALAALLACEPRVLLLDEPTAGMDRGTRLRFAGDLRRWRDESPDERAAILCTHDPAVALACADRAMVLHEGGVAALGPVGEVFRSAGRGPLASLEASALTRIARRLGASAAPKSAEELLGGIVHAG